METKTYDNNNSGALFPNDRKEKETHADLTGSCEIEGKEYWFKGWKKTAKSGTNFLSVSFDPKGSKARRSFIWSCPNERRSYQLLDARL